MAKNNQPAQAQGECALDPNAFFWVGRVLTEHGGTLSPSAHAIIAERIAAAPTPPEAGKSGADGDAKEIARLTSSRNFYARRCDALQAVQDKMRDPERKMVCDILANGETYTTPAADVPVGELPVAWRCIYPDGSKSNWTDGTGHWPKTKGFAGGKHGFEYAYGEQCRSAGVVVDDAAVERACAAYFDDGVHGWSRFAGTRSEKIYRTAMRAALTAALGKGSKGVGS